MLPVALTMAGSDPSGGAGLQADLKTFHQFSVYGAAVVTLLTVQNTRRVSQVEPVPASLVGAQIEAVLEDLPPAAAKCGALGTTEVIELVAGLAAHWTFPLVVDPVMISKHGAPLLADAAREALTRRLLPVTYLLTPNLPEAEALLGRAVRTVDDMERAARDLAALGPRAVLVKGGHRAAGGEALDVLFCEGRLHHLNAPRYDTPHTHGTGCTYSAAITAGLALGLPLAEAAARAKRFIAEAIRTNPGLGGGHGPVNHHASTE
jgi:hydroxymethylpyrimidine/phosphomethylpyrimidine kinase